MERKYRTDEEWLAILNDQKESGLQVRQFCRSNGIPESQFYKRRKKLELPEQSFLPVEAVEYVEDVKRS